MKKEYLTSEITKEENNMKLDLKKTELSKHAFIERIKNGLGDEIKANPNSVEIIKKPKETFLKKILIKLKRIF
jgi:hypothetical protein